MKGHVAHKYIVYHFEIVIIQPDMNKLYSKLTTFILYCRGTEEQV